MSLQKISANRNNTFYPRLEVEDIYIQKLNNWDSKWKKNLETKADEFTKKSVSGELFISVAIQVAINLASVTKKCHGNLNI